MDGRNIDIPKLTCHGNSAEIVGRHATRFDFFFHTLIPPSDSTLGLHFFFLLFLSSFRLIHKSLSEQA